MLNRFRYKYGTPTKFALKFSLRIPRVEGNQNDNIPFLTYILYSQTAAKRRHPGLLKLEDRAVADAEAKEMAAIERDREHIRQQRADLEKLMAQEQRMDFLDRVAREDRVRFESELSRAPSSCRGRLVGETSRNSTNEIDVSCSIRCFCIYFHSCCCRFVRPNQTTPSPRHFSFSFIAVLLHHSPLC